MPPDFASLWASFLDPRWGLGRLPAATTTNQWSKLQCLGSPRGNMRIKIIFLQQWRTPPGIQGSCYGIYGSMLSIWSPAYSLFLIRNTVGKQTVATPASVRDWSRSSLARSRGLLKLHVFFSLAEFHFNISLRNRCPFFTHSRSHPLFD